MRSASKATLLCACLLGASARAQVTAEPENVFPPPQGDEGCWVALFAGENFKPPSARLTGRTFIESFESGVTVREPDLEHVGGQSFMNEVRSLVVGPHARLVGYAEPRFRKESVTFESGRHVADLSRFRFQERVRSVKVFCGDFGG